MGTSDQVVAERAFAALVHSCSIQDRTLVSHSDQRRSACSGLRKGEYKTRITWFSAFLPAGFIHTNPSSGAVRQVFGLGLQNVKGAEIHLVGKVALPPRPWFSHYAIVAAKAVTAIVTDRSDPFGTGVA